MEKANVVFSVAGHDKGSLMVVLAEEGKYAVVVDGKHRKLCKPKIKNIKHISKTDFVLKNEDLLSNRTIRRALRRVREEGGFNYG